MATISAASNKQSLPIKVVSLIWIGRFFDLRQGGWRDWVSQLDRHLPKTDPKRRYATLGDIYQLEGGGLNREGWGHHYASVFARVFGKLGIVFRGSVIKPSLDRWSDSDEGFLLQVVQNVFDRFNVLRANHHDWTPNQLAADLAVSFVDSKVSRAPASLPASRDGNGNGRQVTRVELQPSLPTLVRAETDAPAQDWICLLSPELKEKLNRAPEEIITIDTIDRFPDQPRREFDLEDLREMGESLKTVQLQSIIVVLTPNCRYSLVDGERRFRAAQMAEIKFLRAKILTDISYQEQLMLSCASNFHRVDHSNTEMVYAVQRLRKAGFSVDYIAQMLGRRSNTIEQYERLGGLPEEVLDCLSRQAQKEDRQIGLQSALLLARLHPNLPREIVVETLRLPRTRRAAFIQQTVLRLLAASSDNARSGKTTLRTLKPSDRLAVIGKRVERIEEDSGYLSSLPVDQWQQAISGKTKQASLLEKIASLKRSVKNCQLVVEQLEALMRSTVMI